MKKPIYIFLISLFVVTRVAYSQALYKDANDFLAGKTTHAGKQTRIKLHQMFKRNIIEVKHNDTVFTYYKKDVFGFIDKDGNVSRFYSNGIYSILNPTEGILVYKMTRGTGSKNSPIVESYFFSKDAGSEILALTLGNVERAFVEYPEFIEKMEIYFKTDSSLVEYDHVHNMYKINRLMQLAKRA